MSRFVTFLALLPVFAQGAPVILLKQLVFEHRGSDPRDESNQHGFNHAPSIVLLPDSRLLTMWFTAPFEGSAKQCLMGSFSADGARSWRTARVMQDFLDRSDFDSAFIAAGSTVLLALLRRAPKRGALAVDSSRDGRGNRSLSHLRSLESGLRTDMVRTCRRL